MTAEIRCPNCSENEELQGSRTDDDLIEITCLSCDARWRRDPRVRCPRCDSTDMYAAPVAVIEKSRGSQLSIVSTTSQHFCWACDRDLIDEQRRSGTALMPDQLPTIDSDRQSSGAPDHIPEHGADGNRDHDGNSEAAE